MPVFEFQASNGGPTVEIEADSLAKAQDIFVKIPGVQGMRSSSPWERLSSGFQQSWGDTAYGAKQLAGGDLDQEQQALVDQPIPEDTAGLVGYMGGELSQLAAPGGVAAKVGTKMGRYGPMLMDLLLNAGHGYTKATSEGESRMGNVAENVAGTLAGRGAARMISGVQPAPGAMDMVKRGVRLSPGQVGGKWSVPGMLEQTAEVLPFGGTVSKNMRRTGIKDWNQDRLASVSPDGLPPKKTGRDGIGEISSKFNDAYKRLLPNDLVMQADDQFTNSLTDILERYTPLLDPNLSRRLSGNLEKLWDMASSGNLTGQNFKSQLKSLRKQATQTANIDHNVMAAFNEAVNALQDLSYRNLGGDAVEQLKHVDSQYSRFAPVQEAMTRQGALTEGLFTPTQLISTAAGRGTGRRAAARGQNRMVEEAITAEGILGNTIPAVGPGTGEKVGLLASMLEPNLFAAGATFGLGYPLIAPAMRNPNQIADWLGRTQISSQGGQAFTDR